MIDTRGGMISMNKPNKGFIEEDLQQRYYDMFLDMKKMIDYAHSLEDSTKEQRDGWFDTLRMKLGIIESLILQGGEVMRPETTTERRIRELEDDVTQLRSELSTAVGYIVHTDNTVASLNNKINEMREEKNTAYNFAQSAQANALAALDQAEIEEAKQIADEAVEQIIKAIVNAGSKSLDDTIQNTSV